MAKAVARVASSRNHSAWFLGLTPQALCWRPLRGLHGRKQGSSNCRNPL